MKKNYTETLTWITWRQSLLGNFPPNQTESKVLFALLLGATSATNLENLSESEFIPDTCRLSADLKRALKQVWRVMTEEKEQWVIIAASLEGLGLGLGFVNYYWDTLKRGRPILAFAEENVVLEFSLDQEETADSFSSHHFRLDTQKYIDGKAEKAIILLIPKDGIKKKIYSKLEVTMPDNRSCRANINLESNTDFLRRVEVRFYYSAPEKILAVISFDQRIFTEQNILLFENQMPPYSVVNFPYNHRLRGPAICYGLDIRGEEINNLIEIGEFLCKHKESSYPYSFQQHYVNPKEGFLEAIKVKLKEIGVPFADSITLN